MQLLKKRILQDGKCYEGGILKVDGFINHKMDRSQRHRPCYHDRLPDGFTSCICKEKVS